MERSTLVSWLKRWIDCWRLRLVSNFFLSSFNTKANNKIRHTTTPSTPIYNSQQSNNIIAQLLVLHVGDVLRHWYSTPKWTTCYSTSMLPPSISTPHYSFKTSTRCCFGLLIATKYVPSDLGSGWSLNFMLSSIFTVRRRRPIKKTWFNARTKTEKQLRSSFCGLMGWSTENPSCTAKEPSLQLLPR